MISITALLDLPIRMIAMAITIMTGVLMDLTVLWCRYMCGPMSIIRCLTVMNTRVTKT